MGDDKAAISPAGGTLRSFEGGDPSVCFLLLPLPPDSLEEASVLNGEAGDGTTATAGGGTGEAHSCPDPDTVLDAGSVGGLGPNGFTAGEGTREAHC